VDTSGKGFLFTLKNAGNIPPRKFALTKQANAIYCRSDYGPTFGGGHDIHVVDGCNGNAKSYTNFAYSYMNDTGRDGKQVLIGESNFTVEELEVFAVDVAQ
jgi:hypothetical protein